MTRRRRGIVLGATALLIAVTACPPDSASDTGTDTGSPTPAEEAAPLAATASAMTPDPGMSGEPRDNPRRANDYLDGLRFGGGGSNPPIASDEARFDCGNALVMLRIEPEHRVKSFDMSAHMKPNHGRLVARITNVDPGGTRCDTLQLKKGKSAHLWVGQDASGNQRIMLYRISKGLLGWFPRADSAAKGSRFVYDGTHGDHGASMACWDKPSAPGQSCEPPPPPQGVPPQPQPLHNHDDAWISCVGGCCHAQVLFGFGDLP